MRILHVTPGLAASAGGPPTAVVDAALAVRPHGFESTIATTDLPGPASLRTRARAVLSDLPPGAEETDLRMFPVSWPRRLAYSPELNAFLASETRSFDLVHIHSLFLFPQYAAFRQALRAGVPYVVSPHGALHPTHRVRGPGRKALVHALWGRRMLAGAAAFHLTSVGELRAVADVSPAVPRTVVPLVVGPNVPPSTEAEEAFRRRLPESAGPVLLTLGRISHRKNLRSLVRAFGLFAESEPTAVLVLAGPDSEGATEDLRREAVARGLERRVVFTGLVTGEAKLAALAGADAFVLASEAENFSLVLGEALAAGLPSVVSSSIDLAPDLEAERAAVLVEPTPQGLAAGLRRLFADPGERKILEENGRRFARRFEPERVGRQWADFYRAVAGQSRETVTSVPLQEVR